MPRGRVRLGRGVCGACACCPTGAAEEFYLKRSSEDVTAEVLILDDLLERAGDVRGVERLLFGLEVRPLEADDVEHLLHDRVQAARADVLGLLVDADGEARDGV